MKEHEKEVMEHYRLRTEIQHKATERDYLRQHLSTIQVELNQAEQAEHWLRWRDGLDASALAPWSVDDTSWIEACGSRLLLQSPVIMRPGPGYEGHMSKPAKPENICLFPELYEKKPQLKVNIRSAMNLKQLGKGEIPELYCVCEIIGKPHAKFRTGVQTSWNPRWDYMAEMKGFEQGDGLHFTVFSVAKGSRDYQPGAKVRIAAAPSDSISKLNGELGIIMHFDQSRNSWMVSMDQNPDGIAIPRQHVEPDMVERIDVFMGSCTISSKKLLKGFDGPLQLEHTGLPPGTNATLSLHIDPLPLGSILQGTTRMKIT
jgi:hypothetical protein